MDRFASLRRHTDRKSLGIEIAPYFNPIVTKAAGYNVLIVDVFDTKTLREKAVEDPHIPTGEERRIEDVDIVADASNLIEAIEQRGLSARIGYIVSSHNFEHLPNPIRFLQGCSKALRPGGVLTMAIPDYRACFDHFRTPTKLADWLSAYHRGVTQPSPETRFDFRANQSMYMRGGVATVGCDISADDPASFAPARVMREAYAEYLADLAEPGPYKDAHCSTVFGASFELMVRDLRHLGIIDLEVVEVTPSLGLEFFAYLRKPAAGGPVEEDDETYYARRASLQRSVNAQLGSSAFIKAPSPALPRPPVLTRSRAKRLVRGLFGQAVYARLAALNAARRRRW